MKKKKLNLSRTDFPVVSSLDNLEVGRIYQTTNYGMIKPLEFNRGEQAGYVSKRVAAIVKMIEEGTFMSGVIHVLVNLNGDAIDGNNRKYALELKGLPLNFMITAEDRFNLVDSSEILNNVSEYNAINSAWFDNDSYLSALAYDEPTAIAIFNLKASITENWGAKIAEQFTPSRVVVLATKDKKGLSSAKQTRRVYCSDEIAETIQSVEFNKLVDFICKVLKFVFETNDSITPWYVVRQLMPDIWKHELSLNIVLKNIKSRGFKKLDNTKMSGVQTRVKEILKMGNI